MLKSDTLFRFKQFDIQHGSSAMKVGTDGVLIGAWSNHKSASRILDIGTGSGLIAVMLAQRFTNSNIVGIEPDDDACVDASINFNTAPFRDRLNLEHMSIQDYHPEKQFDLIVSNPPFFDNGVKPPIKQRAQARHTSSLSLFDLCNAVNRLLTKDGCFSVILPKSKEEELIQETKKVGLYLKEMTEVRGRNGTPVKRILALFSRKPVTPKRSELVIENNRHNYTEEYKKLTSPFYLKM